jgi:hypothetical protein
VTLNSQAENKEQQAQDQVAIGELARLLDRAEHGDASALPELRKALDADSRLWAQYGDLALHAEAALGVRAAGTNLYLGEALNWKLQSMKDELGGDAASPLERLLVSRVVMTWMQTAYFDALAAQASGANDGRTKMIHEQQEAAHRRHLTAAKTLATVRKLLTPSLSPVQIATRLEGQNPAVRRGREGIAGTVPVTN